MWLLRWALCGLCTFGIVGVVATDRQTNAVDVPRHRDKRQAVNAEAYMTTPEIIRHRGYPVETHQVTTSDGYILTLHRIPWTKKARSGRKRKVVFLQHGMISSDHVWIITPSSNALAFVLADRGYDVWMGNSRGTTYSKQHVTLDSDDKEYWDFTWDEMGQYDLPASLDYVLRVTQQPTLIYVGHSLGCGIFFIAMNEHPHLNARVEVMVALAPASSLANLKRFRPLVPFFNPFQNALRATGVRAVFSPDSPSVRFNRFICKQGPLGASLCRDMMLHVFGRNPKSLKMDLLHVINHHYPSGGSLRTIAHALQNHKSGEKFTQFDYGRRENVERYGTAEPPEYDLAMVTVPVYIFWSQNDPISPPQDVAWIAENLANVKASIRVPDPLYNHMDFVWHESNNVLVNPRLLALLPPP